VHILDDGLRLVTSFTSPLCSYSWRTNSRPLHDYCQKAKFPDSTFYSLGLRGVLFDPHIFVGLG